MYLMDKTPLNFLRIMSLPKLTLSLKVENAVVIQTIEEYPLKTNQAEIVRLVSERIDKSIHTPSRVTDPELRMTVRKELTKGNKSRAIALFTDE